MDEENETVSAVEEVEPQITSADPEERKRARRLRIQRRNEALRKQQHHEGDEKPEEVERTLLEKQVDSSDVQLGKLFDEGVEQVTNIKVGNDAREVERRVEEVEAKSNRLELLEQEAAAADSRFKEISARWSEIASCIDPLDIHHAIENQRAKCNELLEQKNELLAMLRKDLDAEQERFVHDQHCQKRDLRLLVQRINGQIEVMRRAYREELKLIEQAIDLERAQQMEANARHWELLYRDRERAEVNHMEKRVEQLVQFEKEMETIIVEHQEQYRETKIKLETDIQVLQQELEQVRSVCLLNSEKLDYNYQVLKKRDEENTVMKSQQKRHINKLQDVVNALRKKIAETERTTKTETTRLTEEVVRLHRNIVEIESKAEHFSEVNERKYQQVWQMNKDTANKLLNKILETDRILHEQQLGLDWKPPKKTLTEKTDLESYRSAVRIVASMHQSREPAAVCSDQNTLIVEEQTTESALADERLLRHILQRVADSSGFLVEERLHVLLEPYTEHEKTLVRVDNVFMALGVHSERHIQQMKQYFLPYCHCTVCEPDYNLDNAEKEVELRGSHSSLDTDASQHSSTTEGATETTHTVEDCSVLEEITPAKWFGLTQKLDPSAEDTAAKMTTGDTSALQKSHKSTCSLSHPLVIEPIFVLKALREFTVHFSQGKNEAVVNMTTRLATKRSTVSRLLTISDVTSYWMQYENVFTPQREKLWDGLLLGLYKYREVLEDRHRLNQEATHLQKQNAELGRLLRSYMSSKGTESAYFLCKQTLPPLSKTGPKKNLYLHSVTKPSKKK